MKLRSLSTAAVLALALAACGRSGQKPGGADTTAVQPAPVTAPAVPPSAPTGADSQMAGHNLGSDTMTHDSMKKDSSGM
jgi:hypothetical protein